jgi:hypothetical protein
MKPNRSREHGDDFLFHNRVAIGSDAAIAVLTKRNSIMISMGQNAENVRTAFEKTTRFPDFQAEYIRGHSSDAVRLAGSQDYATRWAGSKSTVWK